MRNNQEEKMPDKKRRTSEMTEEYVPVCKDGSLGIGGYTPSTMPPPKEPRDKKDRRKVKSSRSSESSTERRDSSRDSRRSYESHRGIGSSRTDSECSSRRGRDTYSSSNRSRYQQNFSQKQK